MLRSKGVIIDDRTAISKLPKLVAAYLWLNSKDGTAINVTALQDWVFYIFPLLARNQSELKTINDTLKQMLGEVAEMQKLLEEGVELMDIGNLKEARDKFLQVLNFDISRIPDYLAPMANSIMKEARKYIEDIDNELQRIKARTRGSVDSSEG